MLSSCFQWDLYCLPPCHYSIRSFLCMPSLTECSLDFLPQYFQKEETVYMCLVLDIMPAYCQSFSKLSEMCVDRITCGTYLGSAVKTMPGVPPLSQHSCSQFCPVELQIKWLNSSNLSLPFFLILIDDWENLRKMTNMTGGGRIKKIRLMETTHSDIKYFNSGLLNTYEFICVLQ